MKFNQLQGFVFDNESGVLGAVAGVDFIKQTISILADDDSIVVAKLSEVQFLEQVGFIGKTGIINHDVVVTASGQHYEVELVDDNNVQLHLLNGKLERIDKGDLIARTDLSVLEPYVQLVGNINVLEVEPAVEFNIKIVRDMTGGEFVGYFYACNNESVEEIDLIKVVFVGHNLLEEEKYERVTVSHEEYLELVEEGSLVEVNPQELANYITGMAYGKKTSKAQPEVATTVEQESFDNEDEEACCDCYECRVERGEVDDEEDREDYCDNCGESVEDCDCEEW